MSKKRKKNSTRLGPPSRTATVVKLRRQVAAANRAAQADPTNHEKLTRAFALSAALKVAEGMTGSD